MKAKPISVPVKGAPFQPGDLVKVKQGTDSTFESGFTGRKGVITYLEYSCGCGQTYPADPMIAVQFPDGTTEEFWAEELEREETQLPRENLRTQDSPSSALNLKLN